MYCDRVAIFGLENGNDDGNGNGERCNNPLSLLVVVVSNLSKNHGGDRHSGEQRAILLTSRYQGYSYDGVGDKSK